MIGERIELTGYQVLAPETAPLAVQLGATTDVDLLLTDMVMPTMLGAEVASDLARAHPGLPVIYMSGYGDRGPELVGNGEYLAKPFTAVELLRAVEKGLLPKHVA
jgi:CheY-like chemotaxis protein